MCVCERVLVKSEWMNVCVCVGRGKGRGVGTVLLMLLLCETICCRHVWPPFKFGFRSRTDERRSRPETPDPKILSFALLTTAGVCVCV